MSPLTDVTEVDGERIEIGTALYHVGTNEIIWCRGREGNLVRLETVDTTFSMLLSDFEHLVVGGDLVVESRPPWSFPRRD